MPRTARASVGGICYHVINCANPHGVLASDLVLCISGGGGSLFLMWLA